LDKYLLKYEGIDEPVGLLSLDFINDEFSIEVNEKYNGSIPSFLRFEDAPMCIGDRIKLWVLERAPETNYEFIDALIEKAGLSEYDAYGFFKYNNGRFITDRFYVEPYNKVI